MLRVLNVQQLLAATCVAAILGSTTVRSDVDDLVVPDFGEPPAPEMPAMPAEKPEMEEPKMPEPKMEEPKMPEPEEPEMEEPKMPEPEEPEMEEPKMPEPEMEEAEKPEPDMPEPEPSSTAEAPTEATPDQSPPVDFEALEEISFFASEAVDYVPGKVPSADVENIGNGVEVESAVECAEACVMDDACNAATFYIANLPEGSKNCYLKTVTPGCTMEGDAVKNPDVWLLMSKERCGEDGAPAPAPGPVAAAPVVGEPVAGAPLDAGMPMESADLPNVAPLLPEEAEKPMGEAPSNAPITAPLTAPTARGAAEPAIETPSNAVGLYAGAWGICFLVIAAALF